ncbi:hypothetical protein CANARDRAFT_27760 [[Candida] arabinofermentans NRRL YB-2248]|uniref:Uncharacterized protein n=1 Tax=[Candida] arabinofermentans NRRL YB-2248 TaxID=983967 RepID=A0A1E4T1R0_9ASCO|nr:hypothetical protein CANARDRAFT_27760 [[Candida] arabinofermentans NRRL YB-2248]
MLEGRATEVSATINDAGGLQKDGNDSCSFAPNSSDWIAIRCRVLYLLQRVREKN